MLHARYAAIGGRHFQGTTVRAASSHHTTVYAVMRIFERIRKWWNDRREAKVSKDALDWMTDAEMHEEAVMRAYRSAKIVVANRRDDGTVEFSEGGEPVSSCKQCRPK